MKISELNIDLLTDEQVKKLVLNSNNMIVADKDKSKTCVVILGGYPHKLENRVLEAKEFFNKGYKNFILLGGKGWQKAAKLCDDKSISEKGYSAGKTKKELDILKKMKVFENISEQELLKMPESELMKRIAISLGIQEECIIKEWYSTNTLENMQNLISFIEGNSLEKIILITSPIHLTRARLTLLEAAEGAISVEGMPSIQDSTVMECRVEAKKIQEYIKKGDVFDAEVEPNSCKILWPNPYKDFNESGEGR